MIENHDMDDGWTPGAKPGTSPSARKRRFHLKRALVLVCLFLAAGALVWHLVSERSFTEEITAALPVAEKREILSVVREDAYRQTWNALKSWRVKPALAWFRSALKPKSVTIGRQGDGNVWIHVGIRDKTAPDGYSIWSRYILTKQKGHWTISTRF